MTELLPSVAQADADGEGPPKRARRPALSCVECRMRKVKCDRQEPCGACIRIKSEKCTYRPSRSGIRREVRKSPSSQGGKNAPISSRCSVQSNLQSQRSPACSSTQLDTGSAELVAALLHENGRLRSAINQGSSHEVDIRPISDIVTDIPGSFQKSKFFGQSHWMNAMEPVRSAAVFMHGHFADYKAVWIARRAKHRR